MNSKKLRKQREDEDDDDESGNDLTDILLTTGIWLEND